MSSIVDQNYWDKGYQNLTLRYNEDSILFKEIFDKYLKPNGTCFEVGCYPGGYLVYLGKKFNYTVNGIDRTPFIEDRLPSFLNSERVKIGHFFNEDFLNFDPPETYDVVCSFGFIEHFSDLDAVIEKHTDLLKPSGILIIACPNFTRGQYIFHRLFDSKNLDRHVVETMSLPRWREILKKNNMEILYDGYYKTINFWTESFPQNFISQKILDIIQKTSNKIDRHVHIPNRWFSPYMISISKKSDDV
ncbi:class I SAM-dependent methyltransferase [Methanosphaerula subterraneus]|uniref:class I SAM-dependent methyltransferase n=1 Tax=Methanosphaerula subterraneus TaxID=3350244 RepID=UPI003F828B3B